MQIISRDDAKLSGLSHYFTGIPCKHGHTVRRYTLDGKCSGCVQARAAKHRRDKPEMCKASDKRWADENRERRLAVAKIYREANPEKVKAAKKKCYDRMAANRPPPKPRVVVVRPKEELRAAANKYFRDRRKTDHVFRLSTYSRNMVRRVLNATGKVKKGTTRDILGYGSEELKARLESLFTEGMTWDNYGEWHIDHKTPVSIMVASGITDPSVINALSNLQPMWAFDNLSKGNRFISK